MWNFFLNHYRFTYILIIASIVIGLISTITIPKESTPEVKIPVGTVMTVLSGASSEDVERLITNEIEDKISTLEELDTYSSISAEGVSMITVTFDSKSDIDERIRALKDAVDEALPDLPGEVERPFVKEISFDDEPIMYISLAANVHDIELKRIAEDTADKLERIKGISEIDIIGAYDREAQIVIDQRKLELYDISISQVLQVLRAQNSTLPGGTLEYDGIRYPVKFEGDIESPEEIGFIPITTIEGTPIYVRDIATVVDSTKRPSTISRVSMNGETPKNAVTLNVKKRTGGDIIEISDTVKSEVEKLQKDILRDATVFYSLEMAEYIKEDLTRLIKSGTQTIIIVTLLLVFILGLKPALIAGLSIPLSFLIAIAGLSYMDSTINFLSLFSLVLALGILVDSAIVLVEGCYKKIEEGQSSFTAAKNTIAQFKAPITSGVGTTVAAMVPMLFASGVIGEFIKHIPITVTLVLFSSLFVTLAFLPALTAKLLKKGREKKANGEGIFTKFRARYAARLKTFLQSKREKRMLSAALIIGFVLSIMLPATGILKVSMFPQGESELIFFDIETPASTTLEETDKVMKQIEELVLKDDRVESFSTNTGRPFVTDITSLRVGETTNLGHIIANLKPSAQKHSLKMVDEYRSDLKKIKGAKVRVTQIDDGPPTGAPVSLKFTGDSLNELEVLARKAEKLLKSIPGTENIRSSTQDTELNFVINIDRTRAMQVGLTSMDVAQVIRTAVHGIETTTIKATSEDIDILVKLDLNPNNKFKNPHLTNRTTIDSLKTLNVKTPTGEVPLSSIVDISLEGGQGSIVHEDGERIVQTTAYTSKGVVADEIITQIENRKSELDIKEGYALSFGGETEDIEESFADMFRALFIGIFLIAAILVLQFNSFRQPIFVLMTVPLAIIGILPGLVILQLPLSFTAFVGVVALSGIVVNNAILLIDRINENRRNSFEKEQAILEAASSRFRPIILTTLTTIAGITPLALSDVTWGPLGASIIFGLAFSTILTLFVVPMLYLKFAEKEL